MFDEVEFDDNLRDKANEESIFKTSDLKYFLLTFAFIGAGYFVMTKFGKK